ncbi:hypothetical protein PAL_GLEAN10016944 [Pteropus alecto]|uniref:Uncharacterized protein n=1 Tax=Pteropus alecto TaxID=9402 RepID=L5JY25_PTEAL|nr:hypothetical protein PAL_GLEAN10016944 [Pteropus alecto]
MRRRRRRGRGSHFALRGLCFGLLAIFPVGPAGLLLPFVANRNGLLAPPSYHLQGSYCRYERLVGYRLPEAGHTLEAHEMAL